MNYFTYDSSCFRDGAGSQRTKKKHTHTHKRATTKNRLELKNDGVKKKKKREWSEQKMHFFPRTKMASASINQQRVFFFFLFFFLNFSIVKNDLTFFSLLYIKDLFLTDIFTFKEHLLFNIKNNNKQNEYYYYIGDIKNR